jgi:RNA polymerase sigma-70 factor (ECF subfamily)
MTLPCPNPADPIRGGGGPHTGHHDDGVVALAVARAKEGDASALHVLYIRYAGEVHHCVNSIVDDHHEAEDITQSVFLKLTRIIAAWLRRVARNAAVDSLRVKRPMPVHELRISEQSPDDLRSERVRDLRQALERLPYEQREVLILRHLAGLSPREIADMLGKTEPAIHGLHHRARTAFKAALRELDAMPVTRTQLTE